MARSKGPFPYRLARRIVTGVIGGTLLVVGAVLLLTPGPGILTILLGLAILAAEFAWARLWLRRLRNTVTPAQRDALRQTWARWRNRFLGRSGP